MIYFVLGTKAQLIKTFPVMRELARRGVRFSYIDTVQHGPLCEQLRAILKVREPDHWLAPRGTQIERTADAVRWALAVLWRGVARRRALFPEPGVVVVHGDTLSTLLGLLIGRLAGQPVCHLEAGERTYRWRSPFPEEIIRRIVDRYAQLLLACGDTQAGNLRVERRPGELVNLGFNTLLDAVQAVADTVPAAGATPGRVLVSIHRFETITSRERMEFLVTLLERLSASERIQFAVHPPTRRKLEEFGLLPRLQALPQVEMGSLLPYPEFVRAIHQAKFLVTDGGGPQEESYFLGTPCLLLRSETERLHPNVFMCGWDLGQALGFAGRCAEYRRGSLAQTQSPSQVAADALLRQPRAAPTALTGAAR